MENPPVIAETLTRSIVARWMAAIDAAYDARKGWDDVVFLCREFYRGAIDFMWSEQFQAKYFGGRMTPRFKINLNKMFDMVALYAPSLVWDQVTRQLKVTKPFQYGPDAFGDPNDPMVQMMFQQAQMNDQQRETATGYQTALLDNWLNYTPREMPDGGMTLHSEKCCVDALISGRGVLMPRDYKMQGSPRKLTGCFWESSENILIDPDATHMGNAQYMIVRCCEPRWLVERERGYAPGALKSAAGTETLNSRLNRSDLYSRRKNSSQSGESYDTIVYYKIWSRMGVGGRLKEGSQSNLAKPYLDKVVGDFAYIEIAEGISHPLNANPAKIRTASDTQVRDMFQWPIPYWIDNRWPAALLDFYHRDDMPYPIPPMSAALGPLIYMNIAMSNLANRVWSSSRDFICIVESAWDTVSKYFKKGDDLALIKVPQIFAGDMEQIVKFMKQPPVSADMYQMLDRMSQEFVMASGLSPTLYGVAGGAQTRSAKAEENREVAAGIRPQHMAKKVDDHQAEVAEMEKQAAYYQLDAEDVRGRVGDSGAALWQRYVIDEPEPERIVRSMRCTVDAASGRRPNRTRDAENMRQLLPAVLPELGSHANATGDTKPVNWFLKMLGESIEQDVSGAEMGPRVPMPPPPEIQQQQQQMAEQEMAATQAKTQADIVKAQAALAKAQADQQGNLIDAELKKQELGQKSQEAQLEAEANLTELLFGQEESRLKLATLAETSALKVASAESLAATKIAAAEEMSQIQQMAARNKAKAASKIKPQAKAKAKP